MNKLFIRAFLIVLLSAVIFTPSCKVFVWDPSGVWLFPINLVLTVPVTFNETFTFDGSESSGVVTGFTYGGKYQIQSGTYAKSGNFGVIIKFNYFHTGNYFEIQLTCNSSESAPNSMTGTGTFHVNNIFISDLSVTATKITNLQN